MNSGVIQDFKKRLSVSIKKINNNLPTRSDAKITFRDILYYSTIIIGRHQSFIEANTTLKIDNILNVSRSALPKRKTKLDASLIEDLNNDLLEYIYYDDDEPRIIAVDGTHINLPKDLVEYGFKLGPNNIYCTATLSTLLDIEKEIPINYAILKNRDERKGLINQLGYLRKNDTLVTDKGYFSYKLLQTLIKEGIYVIMRLPEHLTILSNLEKRNDCIVNIEYEEEDIQFRLIKYKVDDSQYYLGTTIFDKNIAYLKDIYWKRWNIETHFRYSKYNLSLRELNSKTENTFMQDIFAHHFIFIISSYFQYLSQVDVKDGYKIHTSNHLNATINELIYLFLYKTGTKNYFRNGKNIEYLWGGNPTNTKKYFIRPSQKETE